MDPLSYIFPCKGPRTPDFDSDGEALYKLYKIQDKYTDNGRLVFGIMYYEEVHRKLYAVEVSELKELYPNEVKTWEKTHARKWEQRHGPNGPVPGNPWRSALDGPLTPAGKLRSGSAASEKRTFDDTPSKSKQLSKKSKKAEDPLAIYDIPKDDDDVDLPDGDVGDEEIADSQVDEDDDVFGPAAKPSSFKSRLAPMAASSSTRPIFRTPFGASAGAGALDDDHDIEDSPTRAPSGTSMHPGSLTMSGSPTKAGSASLRMAIRPSQAGQSTSSLGPLIGGTMGPPPFRTPGGGMRPQVSQSGSSAQPGTSSSVMGAAMPRVSAGIPQQARISGDMSRPSPSSVGQRGTSRPPVVIPLFQPPPVTSSNPAGPSVSTASDSDEEPIIRRTSSSSKLAQQIAGLKVWQSDSDDEVDQKTPARKAGSDEEMGEASLESEESSQQDAGGIGQKGIGELGEEVADVSIGSGAIDNAEAIEEAGEVLDEANKMAEDLYAESQRQMQEEEEDEDAELPATQAQLEDGTAVYDDYSAKLIEAHGESLDALVKVAMSLGGMPCDGWVRKRKEGPEEVYKNLMFVLWIMLVHWDPLILKHLVHGDIPVEYNKKGDLYKKLRDLRNLPKGVRIPSIYIQCLVDSAGKSPPKKVLLEILDHAESYVEGLDDPSNNFSHHLAITLDQALPSQVWTKDKAMKGARRYIDGPVQARKCTAWIEASRQRLESLPDDAIISRPWAECGYATIPNDRLGEHSKHLSSNYLMNLTDAICIAKLGGKYKIEQFVLYQIFHYTHAMYGEILASRLGLVYTTQGGGFSHQAAGISLGKVEKTDSEHFARKQKEMLSDPEFGQRYQEDIEKVQKKAETIEELDALNEKERDLILDLYAGAQLLEEKEEKLAEKEKAWAEDAAESRPLDDFLAFAATVK
ncbi:hypothetical protein V8E51_013782 [Hyaloscypha variabilis]